MVEFLSGNLDFKARNQVISTSPAPWLLIHIPKPSFSTSREEGCGLMVVGAGCLMEKLFLSVGLGKYRTWSIWSWSGKNILLGAQGVSPVCIYMGGWGWDRCLEQSEAAWPCSLCGYFPSAAKLMALTWMSVPGIVGFWHQLNTLYTEERLTRNT